MPIDVPHVRRELLSDQAHDLIRGWIVDGRVAPGERLVESAISRQLGISQAPVREAIKQLAHEGLVTRLPRRGSFVTQISPEEAAQAREVRSAIEQLAAWYAALAISADGIVRLRLDVDAMRTAAAADDIASFRDADISFHRRVCAESGNPFLPRLWQVMEPSLRVLHVVSDPLFAGDWVRMAEEHDELVRVLEAGDPAESAHRFAAHGRPKVDAGKASGPTGKSTHDPADARPNGRPEFAIRMP